MLINGIQIEKRGHILEITYEEKILNQKVRADFQPVNTQYGEYYMFAIANEGYYKNKQLFISSITKILPGIANYLISETDCDLRRMIIDHRDQLILV